jgi:hypothetical protein
MMAITSAIVASHFAILGNPYPGQSVENLQLIIFVAAAIIFTGGLYFFHKDVASAYEGEAETEEDEDATA